MNGLIKLLSATFLAGIMVATVQAKLPEQPVDQAKAHEASMQKAEAAKKAADALSKAQDRTVENYKRFKSGGAMPVNSEAAVKPKATK